MPSALGLRVATPTDAHARHAQPKAGAAPTPLRLLHLGVFDDALPGLRSDVVSKARLGSPPLPFLASFPPMSRFPRRPGILVLINDIDWELG